MDDGENTPLKYSKYFSVHKQPLSYLEMQGCIWEDQRKVVLLVAMFSLACSVSHNLPCKVGHNISILQRGKEILRVYLLKVTPRWCYSWYICRGVGQDLCEGLRTEFRFQGAHRRSALGVKSPDTFSPINGAQMRQKLTSPPGGQGCHSPSRKFCSDFGLSASRWFLMNVQREKE